MNDSELIKNPKTNRFVKKGSQTGKRLLKELATPSEPVIVPPLPPLPTPPPVQSALLSTCAEIVVDNTPKFKNLTAAETDALFRRLLLERLSIAPAKPKKKKKGHFRVESSSSSSESD